ncbi:FAD-dependent monooxygenase [Granulicella cerasi]|uniref:FAD-dependent monooxygenase n=1 Tax=Granulicella cerasi TaxID=741063 RepID=A0ABW1Z7R5_9BACT
MFVEFVARGEKPKSMYDTVIAGAGPVGLLLACELAMRERSVLVLEKSVEADSPLKRMPFGLRGLNAPSVESLDTRGLLDEFEVTKRVKNPHAGMPQGAKRPIGHFAGIPIEQGLVDSSQWKYRLESSAPPIMLTEMAEVEQILARRAEELGVEILRGVDMTGYAWGNDHVLVECGERHFRGRWLVGCDGARSVVRKQGGFAFEGTEPEFTGYSLSVELHGAEALKPGRVMTTRGMYLQSQPGYMVLQDFDGGAFHASGRPITREHVQEVLRRISESEVTVTAVLAATTWTDRARQATSYRKGNVLLAGDAAHIHAPLGGQGLNLGLGDAMNLGWKLAAVIAGEAEESLLDSYEAERIPVGISVLDWSRAQVAMMKPTPEARAQHAIMRDMMETRDGATYVAGRVWGVTTRYEVGDAHPLVGMSAPNFAFDDGATMATLLRDGRGVLLDFAGDDAVRATAEEFALPYARRVAKDSLGLGAVLVRPDGIVAWVAESDVPLRRVLERWFARKVAA